MGLRIQGKTVVGEEITLGAGQFADFICDGAVLEKCVLNLAGPSSTFVLHNATLRSCRVKVAKRLSDYQFAGVRFERCAFEGMFSGCRFGDIPEEIASVKGAALECDFGRAKLHLCDFLRNDLSGTRWHPWPGFVVLNPFCSVETLRWHA